MWEGWQTHTVHACPTAAPLSKPPNGFPPWSVMPRIGWWSTMWRRELMGTSAPGVLGHSNAKQKIQVGQGSGLNRVS